MVVAVVGGRMMRRPLAFQVCDLRAQREAVYRPRNRMQRTNFT